MDHFNVLSFKRSCFHISQQWTHITSLKIKMIIISRSLKCFFPLIYLPAWKDAGWHMLCASLQSENKRGCWGESSRVGALGPGFIPSTAHYSPLSTAVQT